MKCDLARGLNPSEETAAEPDQLTERAREWEESLQCCVLTRGGAGVSMAHCRKGNSKGRNENGHKRDQERGWDGVNGGKGGVRGEQVTHFRGCDGWGREEESCRRGREGEPRGGAMSCCILSSIQFRKNG